MECKTCSLTSAESLSDHSSWFESPLPRNAAGFEGQFDGSAKLNKNQLLNPYLKTLFLSV